MTEQHEIEIRNIAADFLEGRLRPLEAAVALAPFEDKAPPQLKSYLTAMVAVASQTDDIPLGDHRGLWHPNVRVEEDRKHDNAQAWAEPMVRETCVALTTASI